MNEKIPYELLARYFTGESPEDEITLVEKWRKESPDNEQVFKEFEAIWRHSNEVHSDFNPDSTIALNNVNARIELADKEQSILPKTRGVLYYSLRIAALLMLSLAVWYGFHNTADKATWVAETNNGKEPRELFLSDGSKITLNSNSIIKFPEKFGKKTRDIQLEGEAFFEVARNMERPFIIIAQNSVTQVLGTSFNLRARPEEEEVVLSVAEGKVAFSSRKNEQIAKVTLEAGETAILNKPVNAITEAKSEDMNYMAWKTGILRFNNTPLTKVAKDLSKFYHTLFYFENSGLDSVKINIEINNMTVDKMIEAMEIIGIQIRNTGNGYVIIPAESQ
ncbi:MAG: FecR domain-containing protein [Bacteroidales bacterium]|nr:FecR domain-containing protein [Bacteroidales bacterium]